MLDLTDLDARALFYEFTADEDMAGASWHVLPDADKAGWRRVAAYVDRLLVRTAVDR